MASTPQPTPQPSPDEPQQAPDPVEPPLSETPFGAPRFEEVEKGLRPGDATTEPPQEQQ
jgi:hypothetical protein